MVKIYTETTCDLSLEHLSSLGVEPLPMRLTLDGVEYVDRYGLSPAEFFSILKNAKGVPSTSQITPAAYIEVMEQVKAEGGEALFVVFSSELSSTFQSAVLAEKEVNYPGIRIIDSKAASAGLGLMVDTLARMAQDGASMEELYRKAEWLRDHMEHLVVVENLEMLKRGGRITPVAAFMGGVMNIKPILEMRNGKLIPFEKAKGRKKAMRRIVDLMGERCPEISRQRFFIAHGDDPQGAAELDDMVFETYGIRAALITELGPVIGSHTGPGVLTLFFLNAYE